MPTELLKVAKGGVGTVLDLEGRYRTLCSDKTGYLDRGREYSRLTLPYILPDSDELNRGDSANQHSWQSVGSSGVKHLANKLAMNMFPVGKSFFSLDFDPDTKDLLINSGYDPISLVELLSVGEERCESFQQKIAARVAYIEVFKNLLITGNVCLHLPKSGHLQAIKLDRYCTSRDLSGRLVELMTVQKKKFNTLSMATQDAIKALKRHETPKPDDKVELYTWVYRKNLNEFTVAQTVCNVMLHDLQDIKDDKLPWLPLRFNSAYGEDYGRGLVEDHVGDLYVIEFLSEALAKGCALMADIKYLVKRGSTTDIDELARSPAGEWVYGNLEDVGVLQLGKYADYTPVMQVIKDYEKRLGQAFLLNSAVRRDAERITTLELRIDAQELETSLGGAYSLLAQTMQGPLALLYLDRVGFPLSGEHVIPTIITGLESLGKIGELDKLRQFTEFMQLPQAWPQAVQDRTNWDDYSRNIAAFLSMKLDFLMSDEEYQRKMAAIQQQQQQAQIMEVAKTAAPAIIKEGGQLSK